MTASLSGALQQTTRSPSSSDSRDSGDLWGSRHLTRRYPRGLPLDFFPTVRAACARCRQRIDDCAQHQRHLAALVCPGRPSVYLGGFTGYPDHGVATVINANGSGRRVLGTADFTPGISWSPDGTYVIGRSSEYEGGLRLIRVNDGAAVSLRFPTATGCCHDYWQPDWR